MTSSVQGECYEMRVVMMRMIGLVEFLNDTELDESQQGFVDGISSDIDRLTELLDLAVAEVEEESSVVSVDTLPVSGASTAGAEIDGDAGQQGARGKGRVLFVEDDVATIWVIQKILESLGFDVEVAESGRAAIERVADPSVEYDLVLMDCNMSPMDGCEATREIREIDSHIPVVALTGDVEARERCMAAGMNGYIAKPVKRDVLGQMIRDMIVSG